MIQFTERLSDIPANSIFTPGLEGKKIGLFFAAQEKIKELKLKGIGPVRLKLQAHPDDSVFCNYCGVKFCGIRLRRSGKVWLVRGGLYSCSGCAHIVYWISELE